MTAVQPEDVAQHSLGVAMIAHLLVTIDQKEYGGDPPQQEILAAALYHDAAEALLTDIVAPVKKYSPELEQAFADLERVAERQLLDTLPALLRDEYERIFQRDRPEVADFVHAADKLDALCKCKQEVRRGNQEFALAEQQLTAVCERYAAHMPSVRYFMDTFLPAFGRSVDEYRYLK